MAAPVYSTAFLPRTIALGLPPRDRRAIEAQIESLIDLLDAIDGDADLEPDDFPGDEADREEDRINRFALPRYGVDQSAGPVNVQQADDIHMAAFDAASAKRRRG